MSWVTGFEYDIFISYARVDDATAEGDLTLGWVAQFHRHLEVLLSQKIGRLNTVKIWRDTRQIQGNELFDKTIENALRGSAVFVALSSQGYLESSYCRQELQSFYEKAQQEPMGLAVDDDYRIFNLLLNNIPRSAFPPEYGRTTGFPLHDGTDSECDGYPCEVCSELFRKKMRPVVEALHETLSGLKERDPASGPSESRRFTVFLADTSDTLSRVRKRVLNELRESPEFDVITGVPPPFESDAHDQRVQGMVGGAQLSVHLLDAYPGREVEGREGSYYSQRQVEVALEHGKSQLIWMPQGLACESIEDENYRAFINRLENGPRGQCTYDFQRDTPSSITREVLAKVKELQSKQQAALGQAPEAALLDTHFKDQMYALDLSQFLLKHNVQPYINPQEADPQKYDDLFVQRLKQVEILILFFGAVAEEWLRARLNVALQIAIAENCPLRACGVYLAPPRTSDWAGKVNPPFIRVEWMDHTKGFNASAVEHLLALARNDGGLRERSATG
jgi:hypothetical protein